MERASHICTHCGYEGKPVRPPSDAESGDDEASKSLARIANMVLPGIGLIIKPLALFLTLPLRILFWMLKRYSSGAKHCPNCGLPLMVPLSSDAGWLAKRKQDIKAGLVTIDTSAPKPVVAFGREVKLPGDEERNRPAPAPKLEKLPSLDDLLAPEPTPDSATEKQPAPLPEPPKKKTDPDAW